MKLHSVFVLIYWYKTACILMAELSCMLLAVFVLSTC